MKSLSFYDADNTNAEFKVKIFQKSITRLTFQKMCLSKNRYSTQKVLSYLQITPFQFDTVILVSDDAKIDNVTNKIQDVFKNDSSSVRDKLEKTKIKIQTKTVPKVMKMVR